MNHATIPGVVSYLGDVVTTEEARQRRLMALLDETKEIVIITAMNTRDKTDPAFVHGVIGAHLVLYNGLSQGYEPAPGQTVKIEGSVLEGVQEGADALLTAFATAARNEGLLT
jgi:hypothetical protein